MIKLSPMEVEFWLAVNTSALSRTQKGLKTLKDKKTKFFSQGFLLDKKAVVEKLTEPKRKKLLAELRNQEKELIDRVEFWRMK